MRIRGGAGLGDSIYLRVIAEHFIRQGHEVVACSDYPEVFTGTAVKVEPFRRQNIDRLCHYTVGKTNPATTQFEDMLASGGIQEPVKLHFDWVVRNQRLVDKLRTAAAGRRIVLVHGGRNPMGRTDGFGRELMPTERGFSIALRCLAAETGAFLVRIGKGPDVYHLGRYLHHDLNDLTSVTDLFDVGMICDGVVAQVSYAVPLAECFGRPLLAIWAAAGIAPGVHMYVQQIVPKKILQHPTSLFCWDDWHSSRIEEVTRQLLQHAVVSK